MASLVDELVEVLGAEEKIYQKLIQYGEQKTDILVRADVPALEELTSCEQVASDDLIVQSNRQTQLLKDIATVVGRDGEIITVTQLIELLGTQPEAQNKLSSAKEKLLEAAEKLRTLNGQNITLLQQAIELNEFDLTLFKSMRQAPETANYDKSACNTGSILGKSGFDASS
ncbi:MAG: flagellar protein FlgN [Lachnospiraceae bacterium]|nr:flagellar protein FlgN [Lachnospiraceae bacterium]